MKPHIEWWNGVSRHNKQVYANTICVPVNQLTDEDIQMLFIRYSGWQK